MISSVGLLIAASAMAVLWYVSCGSANASHVAVAWAALVACTAIVYALVADGDAGQRVLAAALASVWGFRLAGYLYVNRVPGKEEDGRYRSLRSKWGESANRNFFWFFQFQALGVVFFSLPFALVCLDPREASHRLPGSASRSGPSETSEPSWSTASSRGGARIQRTQGERRAAGCGVGPVTRTTSSSG